MIKQIKKGQFFYCFRKFENDLGETLFRGNEVYESIKDGCLVSELGNEIIFIADDLDFLDDFNNHFEIENPTGYIVY